MGAFLQERHVLGANEQSPEKSLHIWCKIKYVKMRIKCPLLELGVDSGGGGQEDWKSSLGYIVRFPSQTNKQMHVSGEKCTGSCMLAC